MFAYPGGAALTRRPAAPLAIPIDTAMAHAVAAVPGLRPSSVSFPQLEGGPVAISGPVAGQNGFLSPHTSVLFDPRTGALLAVRGGPAEAGLVGTLETAVFNLHYAKFGGWPVRPAAVAARCGPPGDGTRALVAGDCPTPSLRHHACLARQCGEIADDVDRGR